MTRILVGAAAAVALSAQNPATPPPAPDTGCTEMATALQRLMVNDVRLRDWANLARYREANRALQAPAAGESRVVFMGDSITDGWTQPRYGGVFPGEPHNDLRLSRQTTPPVRIRLIPAP